MSEVCLVVRDADGDWSGTMHGSCAERAIAALSADPTTLAELEAATARFEKPHGASPFFGNLSPGLCAEPHDAGLVVIDLMARLVMVDSTYASLEPAGAVCYHDGRCCTDKWLPYHLADDWLLTSDGDDWQAVAEARRRERAGQPLRDVREIFYGRPMLEYIARETFAAFTRRALIAAAVREQRVADRRERLAREAGISPQEVDPGELTDEAIAPNTYPGQEQYASPFYDTLKEIHAAWLLTPREDLGGECPRSVAIRGRDHIGWDLQDRCEQWSCLREAPPGLAESSFAFRYGSFGTHELVEYYELVRAMLWSCWERLTELEQLLQTVSGLDTTTVEAFLAIEVPRLEEVREEWLDTPDPELGMRTPRSLIRNERARMPEAISGRDAMVDPDCPCCQMLADLPGPGFWNLDTCNMDEDFAFDIYNLTREDWELEHDRWEENARRFNAKRNERELLGVTLPNASGDAAASIWTSSFAVGNTADVPLGVRVFGVGCHLAELIVDLREAADGESSPKKYQPFIERLNRDFGNLRELLHNSEPSLAEALVIPVIDRFGESLTEVATVCPDLAAKCESLTNQLITLLDQPPSTSQWESSDLDLPF